MIRVEVMGRDTSVVSRHDAMTGVSIRSIIPSDSGIDGNAEKVRFDLKPHKVDLFDIETFILVYILQDLGSIFFLFAFLFVKFLDLTEDIAS